MSDARNRKQVAEQVIGLCSGYMRKSVGDELAFIIFTFDRVDGASGCFFETDLEPDSAVRLLRDLADKLERGEAPEFLRH